MSKSLHFWILVVFAIFFSQADSIDSNSGLTLRLQVRDNFTYGVNTITAVIPGVTLVFSLLNGFFVDR